LPASFMEVATTDREILRVENLKKHFPISKDKAVEAVDGVSFAMPEGEVFGLVGESGSGKSTVAYTVIGMYKATSGRIIYRSQDITKTYNRRSLALKKEVQIVFQDPGSSLNPRQTIGQILDMPLSVHRLCTGQDRVRRIQELLEMVELPPDFMFKYPRNIGGGEKQMVSIARALATNPSFVILDEPTSALDVSVQAKVINLLIRLQKQFGLSYLFITHDLGLMRNLAHRVAIMYLGKVCEVATAQEFFTNPLHPYTRMLLSSIPVLTEAEEDLKPKRFTSRGEIPSPVNVPPGCSFHLRCPEASGQCSITDPSWAEASSGHEVRCHLYTSASCIQAGAGARGAEW